MMNTHAHHTRNHSASTLKKSFVIEPGFSRESQILIEKALQPKPKVKKLKKNATLKINIKQGRRDKFLNAIQGQQKKASDSGKYMTIT